MTEKNYTDKMTSELVEAYDVEGSEVDRDKTVKEFAEKFGKSTRSIRAKLASEGVYVAKVKVVKRKAVTKETLVNSIAKKLDIEFDEVESLKSATKSALILVWNAIFAYDETAKSLKEQAE